MKAIRTRLEWLEKIVGSIIAVLFAPAVPAVLLAMLAFFIAQFTHGPRVAVDISRTWLLVTYFGFGAIMLLAGWDTLLGKPTRRREYTPRTTAYYEEHEADRERRRTEIWNGKP